MDFVIDNGLHFFNAAHQMDWSSVFNMTIRKLSGLSHVQGQEIRSLEQKLKSGLKFITLFKQRTATKNIESKSST